MSVYIVSEEQAIFIALYSLDNRFDGSNIDVVEGRAIALIDTNYTAFIERYPGEDRGPIATAIKDLLTDGECMVRLQEKVEKATPVEVLKIVQNYIYQVDDCSLWELSSRAYRTCDIAMSKAICKLEGYDQAPWGLD